MMSPINTADHRLTTTYTSWCGACAIFRRTNRKKLNVGERVNAVAGRNPIQFVNSDHYSG